MSFCNVRAWATLALFACAGCIVIQPGTGDQGAGGSSELEEGHDDGGSDSGDGGSDGDGDGGSGDGGGSDVDTSGSGDNGPPEPSVVSIRMASALIRPWDTAEEAWDGNTSVSPEDVADLAFALGATDPYVASLAFVYGLADDAYGPPDPFGNIEIFTGGAWRADLQAEILPTQDTFNAPFYDAGWDNIPVEPDMRIRVVLRDEDLANHDPLGTVELNRGDLMAAYGAANVYPVRTDEQDTGTILFVSLSVAAQQ
ncbi:hypothetical protein [Sorangium sp. So ce1151]|uniref:hypothetical protein n=1 Tax=Sorangium sp. So ce1151 TaxID=3133332 RepID=UPI003F60C55C